MMMIQDRDCRHRAKFQAMFRKAISFCYCNFMITAPNAELAHSTIMRVNDGSRYSVPFPRIFRVHTRSQTHNYILKSQTRTGKWILRRRIAWRVSTLII